MSSSLNYGGSGVGSTVEVAEIESLSTGDIIVGDGVGAPTTSTVDAEQSGGAGVFVSGALSTGDGKGFIMIPSHLNGKNLSAVYAGVGTAPTDATLNVQIHNVTDAADMLSTVLSIDSTEKTSQTAATPAVIDTGADDVATGDILRVDIDQVGSTVAGSDLTVTLEFS